MAQVDIILEVMTRSLNQYHHLREFPVRVGRALDNDIILSDLTVSAHHLEIDRNADGQLLVRNLSRENGSKLNRQVLRDEPVALEMGMEPVSLTLGSRRLRLLRADMDVGHTSVRNCSGLYMLFCHPLWSVALLAFTLFAFCLESYLQTIYDKEPSYYLSYVLPYLLGMIAMTLVVAGVSRLSIQRWEVGAALSLVTLFMLGPHLLGELGHWLNYFFTASWPLDTLIVFSNFLWLPLLLYVYIRLVHHSEVMPALGVALLFSAPLLVYQASDFADRMAVANEFTGEANFSRELSSLDVRLAPTVSIDEFMNTAAATLAETDDYHANELLGTDQGEPDS
ncbi:MAG: FHA domain-containing protein [Thiolinea sp.]